MNGLWMRLFGFLGCLLLVACDVRVLEFTGDAGLSIDGTAVIDLGECDPIPEQCNGLDDDCDGETDEDDPDDPNDDLPNVGKECGRTEGVCELGISVCAPKPGCIQRQNCVVCEGNILPEPEQCNGLDDDCDDETDNGFNFCEDPFHCGGCNVSCDLENPDCSKDPRPPDIECLNATFTCGYCGPECEDCVPPKVCTGRSDNGVCKLAACAPGFADADGDPCNGCELPCGQRNPGPEICDGEDNDCDGLVDLDDPSIVGKPFCRQSGECQGSEAKCIQDDRCADCGGEQAPEICWICDYGPTVELTPESPCHPGALEFKCDGLDGNCNALVDESFAEKGTPCDNGLIGGCRVVGEFVCNASGTDTECNVADDPGPPPTDELCNGIDDNCNDVTDENADHVPTGTTGVRDALVRVQRGGLDFYMYRYEASRPGATAADKGGFDNRACSTANVLPWASVSYDEAEAACAAAGMRLCSEEEWDAACFGAAPPATGFDYPYGEPYQPTACNGVERDPDACPEGCVEPTGSLASCDSDDGIFDLSGNLKEWTDDPQPPSPPPPDGYRPRGGSFDNIEESVSCDFKFTVLPPDHRHENLGFRCCCTPGPGCPPP